jgi:hypothetical protein
MNTAYTPVPVESTIASDLLQYALNSPSWTQYYNFMAAPVPGDLLQLDSFIGKLAEKRAFHAGILRMEPNTCYNWHVDTDRKVGLNMLLSDDGGSRCLFLDGEPGVVFKTHELDYQSDTYYVFNTQVPHMVLNTTRPRYLFSLEFLGQDRGLTFDELCEDIKGMNHGY